MTDYTQYDCDATHYRPNKCPMSGDPVTISTSRSIEYACGCYHYETYGINDQELIIWKFMPMGKCLAQAEPQQ
jgi:hypothetical protein